MSLLASQQSLQDKGIPEDFEKVIYLYQPQLSNTTNFLQNILEFLNAMPYAFCFVDAHKRIWYLNDTAIRLFNLQGIDYLNHNAIILLSVKNKKIADEILTHEDMQTLQNGTTIRRDINIKDEVGNIKIYDFLQIPIFNHDKQLKGVAIFAQNVSVQRQLQMDILFKNQQLLNMAITDEMTGVYNRRHLVKRFEEEFEKARRYNHPLSCIIIDIDRFKLINDTYGHLQGDKVIITVCKILRESLRSYDILGRFGGEEFLIILPETTKDSTLLLAERLRENVLKTHVKLNGNPTCITISLGMTSFKNTDVHINDMIKRADDALYTAKKTGRNKAVCL